MKILNLSVSPACITLIEKYTTQLLFITYASLFDNLNAQILDNTTPTRSLRHILIITEQSEIVRYRYFFEFVTYRTIHMYVFIKIFVTNGPTVYFSRIFQILIFLPHLYDYYLSSSIFDLKISYILNMLKSQPPPVFLKSFLLDDVKNKAEV